MQIPVELDHLSVSQLRTWNMCGLRWYYQNVVYKGGYEPGESARLRGTALDVACNEHYGLKALDTEGLKLARFTELAVHVHEQGRDTHNFIKVSEQQSKDRTAKIAKEYHDTFGTLFQPWAAQAVQEKVHYQDDGLLVPVHGIIDLRTSTKVVVDNKVKAKKNLPKPGDLHRDLQLTTYSMMTGFPEVALAVVTDENKPEAVFLPSRRSPAQHQLLRDRYNTMVESIRAGIFNPAPEGSWFCSPSWCTFWNECPYGGADEDIPIPGLED